jgi:hypothetical protein
MAIYSCNLASVGRTTHAAGTAGAHLRYIAREDAEPVLAVHAMPLDPVDARTWMDRQEMADRKNARVLDKIRIALPRELSKEQRLQLARDFCEDLTGNRIPWMLAIHQEGKDAQNPHAHIVVRDRDLESGRRVLRLSDSAREREAAGLEPKAVEWIRRRWEAAANAALERAGHEQRVDRRTLDAQGIEREPTIHLGPRGMFVDGHVHRPCSKKKMNALGREVDYPTIDRGRTRKERHAEIIDLNLERAARSPDVETRAWARFEKAQAAADRKLAYELAAIARQHTREERRVLATHRDAARALKGEHRRARDEARSEHRHQAAPLRQALREKQAQERAALKTDQSSLWRRIARAIDITGGAKRRQKEERQRLSAAQKLKRREQTLAALSRWQNTRDSLENHYTPLRSTLDDALGKARSDLRDMRRRVDAMIEARRQVRESARERERRQLMEALQLARKTGRDHHIDRQRPSPGRSC